MSRGLVNDMVNDTLGSPGWPNGGCEPGSL
jgi:hypothetical protein